jgi:hypothetical protein
MEEFMITVNPGKGESVRKFTMSGDDAADVRAKALPHTNCNPFTVTSAIDDCVSRHRRGELPASRVNQRVQGV